jgi:hypothetical protein
MKFQRLIQITLLVSAVDCLVYGLWAGLWPGGLFVWLQFTTHESIKWKLLGAKIETADELLLWRVLGCLFLAHTILLAFGAWRPRSLGSLIWAPLIGRTMMVGFWLWLLGSERVEIPVHSLAWLAVHDGVVLFAFAASLAWITIRRESQNPVVP